MIDNRGSGLRTNPKPTLLKKLSEWQAEAGEQWRGEITVSTEFRDELE